MAGGSGDARWRPHLQRRLTDWRRSALENEQAGGKEEEVIQYSTAAARARHTNCHLINTFSYASTILCERQTRQRKVCAEFADVFTQHCHEIDVVRRALEK